jgi:hypothetical protein
VKHEPTDIEQQLLDECGFWKKFTGDVRRPANQLPVRLFWVLRLLARALIFVISLRKQTTPRQSSSEMSPCKVLLIYFTENQRRAFRPWSGVDVGTQTASWLPSADWPVSRRRCGWLTLRFFWGVYRQLSQRPDRALTFPWLEEFVRYRVGLVLAEELYGRVNPRVVVVSNDHSGLFRAFIRSARERGCRLVYTQHASIGKNFPVLDFDLTLLDGVQAYLQYRESGTPRGYVVITGRHRPSLRSSRRSGAPVALRLGLATNWDDSLLEWIPLLRRVGKLLPGAVLRCHPAETRKLAWRLLCKLCGIRVDSGTLDAFLGQTNVLISGMSGIILDAALYGIPCLIKVPAVRASGTEVDYYGYEKFQLCKPIHRLEELERLVATCAAQETDFERVGAYEAGLVQAPDDEKRAVLALFVDSVKTVDLRAAFTQRYTRMVHQGVELFVTGEYANLSERHGWLA